MSVNIFDKRKGLSAMRNELAKTYAPKEFEDRIYHNWEEKGYFHA